MYTPDTIIPSTDLRTDSGISKEINGDLNSTIGIDHKCKISKQAKITLGGAACIIIIVGKIQGLAGIFKIENRSFAYISVSFKNYRYNLKYY